MHFKCYFAAQQDCLAYITDLLQKQSEAAMCKDNLTRYMKHKSKLANELVVDSLKVIYPDSRLAVFLL